MSLKTKILEAAAKSGHYISRSQKLTWIWSRKEPNRYRVCVNANVFSKGDYVGDYYINSGKFEPRGGV